ncbi:hypothetical protein Tco_0411406 [Tanacetum coccineum]
MDYAELQWEGLYYSFHHLTSLIPYPRFKKIIISHYMTSFPEISRHARDMYHNLQDDDIMKSIFNSGRHKDKVGMQIPNWMIIEEMKHTEHYRMYAEVFGLDVPLTQSKLTESTQGTHRIPSALRSPTPKMDTAESSAPKRSTVIHFCFPERRSTRLTPPALVPTIDKADEMILQDILQVRARGDKESPDVEITNDEEVEITNVVIPVNVNEEEDEITDEVYELKRREKRKIVEESRNTQFPTPIRSPRTHTNLVSSDTEKLQELTGRYTYLFGHLKERFLLRKSFDTLADHLQEVMAESLPTMVDTHIKEQVKKQVPEHKAIDNQIPSQVDASVRSYMSGHIMHVHPAQSQTISVPEQQYQLYLSMKNDPQPSAVRPRDQDDPYDDAHPKGENSNQEQVDDYDFWIDSYALDDDEIPRKQVSQDIIEEVSLTIDEAKLKKMADEMLRQICTSGDEHQYHIDQMKNFLKSDICIKKFNPYARYGVEHWKNPHAKIFYKKKQKEPGKPKEGVYSNSKIIQVIKTYWELGHEHKFITEIVARRANECIVSTTEPDYKNLNKNDIEDMYLLIMNGKVPDYAETGLLWSLSVFIKRVEKHKIFSIIYEPVHGIIYKNIKKEKRVMRHSEIHKFCDATLNRVLKGLKSYNNDVKYGYVQRELTDDEVEYLKLFEEEIEVRLKYRNQMRR